MPKYEISLDDIINLRDCAHYYRHAIRDGIPSNYEHTKIFLKDITDHLDGVVARILNTARGEEG